MPMDAQVSRYGPFSSFSPLSGPVGAGIPLDRNDHPLACRTCHEYLSHLRETSHFSKDPSTWAQLQLAMREAKRERDITDTFFENHRLEKENSTMLMRQIEDERDHTLALLKKCQANLLHAEQELFETILSVRAALAESGEPYLSPISREVGVRIRQVKGERDAAFDLLEENKGKLQWTQEKLFRALQELRLPSESDPDPSVKDWASRISSNSISPTSTMVNGSPPPAANSPISKAPIVAPTPLVPTCAPEIQAEVLNLRDLQDLIEEAGIPGNAAALTQVSEMYAQAQATPEVQRNILQRYVFRYWTPPSHPPPTQVPATQDHIYVDASLWGIGFVMNGHWLAWKLKDGWTLTAGRDNNWSEMLAVELGLRAAIAAGYRNTVLTIHSDNTGVVKALRTGTTKNTEHNVILRAILVLAQVAAIQIDARWISTRDNPADNPSRGIFPSSIYSFQYPPPIPKHLAKHVDRILVYD